MTASMEHAIAAGVAARVFAHDLGQVACFSYVTRGLARYGQAELVFTLRRAPGDGIERAPRDPLALLQTIAGFAERGQLVAEGGITELGPSGLFGRPQLRGVAYQRAWPMQGVELPDGCLAMIAVVAHEMDTIKQYGALRVLARLGAANRFFPTTPWCDPDRAPAMAPEQQTILAGVARGSLPGVSAVLDGERVVVRIPRALPLPPLPPPEAALAILASLDANADACLVWTPGQQAPAAISPPGSRGARMSGCFVLFVPQQADDAANVFEDGFACMLADASWARVRDALATRAAVTIPSRTGKALAIEWYDAIRAAPPPVPAASEMRMELRESQADIAARVGMDALVGYANAVESTVQRYYAGKQGRAANLVIEIVLAPARPPAIHGALEPELHAHLAAVAPPIVGGEIAFRGTFALFGGAS
jgi:hypothetical protein